MRRGDKKTFTVFHDFSVQPLPRVIRIEVSSSCNLKCIHCPTGTRPGGNKGNMPREIFFKITDEIKSYSGVDVIVLYHGGEPFLNKDIFEMIEVFKSMGIPFVKTVTNGTLINDEMLAKIIDSGLDSIEFSIDGLDPDENNQIRKGADYYQVVSIIKKLLTMKRDAKSHTPDICIANTQIPTEADICNRRKEGISTPNYILNDFSAFKEEIRFKNTYMIKWPAFNCFDKYKLVENPIAKNSQPSNYCDHVIETNTLRWNGAVVPCCYDITGDYVIGNIMEQSLTEIWNNERYKEIRRSIHLRNYIPLCAECNVIRPQLFVAKK